MATGLLLVAACGDNDEVPPREDSTGPVVRILAPAAGAVTSADPVLVRVRVADDVGVTAASLEVGATSIAIDLATLDAAGEATVPVTLGEGDFTLALAATDAAGNPARDTVALAVDRTPPTATLLAPVDGETVAPGPFTARVRVADARGLARATVTVGTEVIAIELGALDAAGEATVALTIPEGTTALVLDAYDQAELHASARASVVADGAAPVIALLAPLAGISETRRLLRATVTDPGGIAALSYAVNGGAPVAVAVADHPTEVVVAAALPLVAGANTLVVTTTDRAGNRRSETTAFRYGLTSTAGGAHSGVVRSGGLLVWGRYNVGQLGLGGTIGDAQSRLAPELLPGFGAAGSTVVAASFNQNTSAALRSDGSLWTWGANGDGQLGVGDVVQRTAPVQVTAPVASAAGGIAYVALGYAHGLALRGDGAVLAWGKNASGQAGAAGNASSVDDVLAPVVVEGLPADVVEVVAGSEHSIALTADGRVFVWGRNTYGNLGGGNTDADRHVTPTLVPGLTDVIDVANGRDHVVAVRADGTVMSWGLGASGQLGYGPSTGASEDRTSPVAVMAGAAPLAGVALVFANGNTSYALLRNGEYWGWGQNFSGQLGIGMTTSEEWSALRIGLYTPGAPPVYLDELVDPRSIGTGATHTIVATETGEIYAWGWNFRGSLGVPTMANAWAQTTPVLVELPQ